MLVDISNDLGFTTKNLDKITSVSNYMLYDKQKIKRIILKVNQEDVEKLIDFIIAETVEVIPKKVGDSVRSSDAISITLEYFPFYLPVLLFPSTENEMVRIDILQLFGLLEDYFL